MCVGLRSKYRSSLANNRGGEYQRRGGQTRCKPGTIRTRIFVGSANHLCIFGILQEHQARGHSFLRGAVVKHHILPFSSVDWLV